MRVDRQAISQGAQGFPQTTALESDSGPNFVPWCPGTTVMRLQIVDVLSVNHRMPRQAGAALHRMPGPCYE